MSELTYLQAQLAVSNLELALLNQKIKGIQDLISQKPSASANGEDKKLKKKRKTTDANGNPLKKRGATGYSLFVKENYVQGEDAFKVIGLKWKNCTKDEKDVWTLKAKEGNQKAEEDRLNGIASGANNAEGGAVKTEPKPQPTATASASTPSATSSASTADSELEKSEKKKKKKEKKAARKAKEELAATSTSVEGGGGEGGASDSD